MKTKKRTKLTRRQKMTRAARYKDAKLWIKDYEGKILVQKYKKRYGLDSILKAVDELLKLGAKLDREYVARIKKSVETNIAHSIAKKESRPVFYTDDYTPKRDVTNTDNKSELKPTESLEEGSKSTN